jgi:hypothetical protein
VAADHKELPKVDAVLGRPKQGVGDGLGTELEDHGSIVDCEPSAHALFELAQRQGALGAFVFNELAIQLGEKREVCRSRFANLH